MADVLRVKQTCLMLFINSGLQLNVFEQKVQSRTYFFVLNSGRLIATGSVDASIKVFPN